MIEGLVDRVLITLPHAQRIAEHRVMTSERSVDGITLAHQPGRIDAGAVTGETRAATAEQRGGDGRSGRGIADAHFTQNDEIGVGRNCVIA